MTVSKCEILLQGEHKRNSKSDFGNSNRLPFKSRLSLNEGQGHITVQQWEALATITTVNEKDPNTSSANKGSTTCLHIKYDDFGNKATNSCYCKTGCYLLNCNFCVSLQILLFAFKIFLKIYGTTHLCESVNLASP